MLRPNWHTDFSRYIRCLPFSVSNHSVPKHPCTSTMYKLPRRRQGLQVYYNNHWNSNQCPSRGSTGANQKKNFKKLLLVIFILAPLDQAGPKISSHLVHWNVLSTPTNYHRLLHVILNNTGNRLYIHKSNSPFYLMCWMLMSGISTPSTRGPAPEARKRSWCREWRIYIYRAYSSWLRLFERAYNTPGFPSYSVPQSVTSAIS